MTPAQLHRAMQDAPVDDALYRQARAAMKALRYDDLIALARDVEWGFGRCPSCDADQNPDGGVVCRGHGEHYEDCELATLLRDLP